MVCALEKLFSALEINFCNAQTRVRGATFMSRHAQKSSALDIDVLPTWLLP